MEEINLKDFFDYYKKYILIIIIVMLLSVAGILSYNMWLKTPLYSTSTTVVLVKKSNTTDSQTDLSDISLNQKLVATYSQIVKSKLVLNQVITNLDLDYSYSELSKEISVNAVDNTEIIKITVTDKNARVASLIANNVAEVFISEVIKIYNMDNVSVIDEAEVNYTPSNNNLIRDAILSMLVSFVAVSGIVFVVYYFDDTLRDVDSIEKEIELPVVAKVFKDKNGIELIVDKKPNAAASESIRTLRTNLQFASVDKAIKTVLLVDCDLRKGRQHKIFKIAGKNGLSNLLIGDISKFKDYVVETKISNLSVMSRGIVPPNPSELLNSKKNKELIEKLNNEFDIVILDGAPITGLSDSLILSSMVDKVLLVTSINHTPKTELLNTKKSLLGVGADLAGCVANNIVAKNHHYGNYYYNSYYYYDDKTKRRK